MPGKYQPPATVALTVGTPREMPYIAWSQRLVPGPRPAGSPPAPQPALSLLGPGPQGAQDSHLSGHRELIQGTSSDFLG